MAPSLLSQLVDLGQLKELFKQLAALGPAHFDLLDESGRSILRVAPPNQDGEEPSIQGPEEACIRKLEVRCVYLGMLHMHPGLRHGENKRSWESLLKLAGDLVETLARQGLRVLDSLRTANEAGSPNVVECRFRRMVEVLAEGIVAVDRELHITYANPRMAELLGFSTVELEGRNFLDFVRVPDRERFLQVVENRRQGQHGQYEVGLLKQDGSEGIFLVSGSPLLDEERQLVGSFAIFMDITERRQAEWALKESEERNRNLLAHLGEGVVYVDFQEVFHFANPAAEELFQVPPGGLIGLKYTDFMDEDTQAYVAVQTERRQKGHTDVYELDIVGAKGRPRRIIVTATPYQTEDGGFSGTLGIFRDITERVRAEEELRRLGTAIEQGWDAILITDTEGILLYVNSAMESLSGCTRDEMLGKPLSSFLGNGSNPSQKEEWWAFLLKGEIWQNRLSCRRDDGQDYRVNATLSPVRDGHGKLKHVVCSVRDITHEEELEAQLRHSQKMEAIGVLAGGIAHDFNNILTPILGYAEMALDRTPDQPKLHTYIRQIHAAGLRATDLVKQILAFSRQIEQPRQAVSVGPIVKECIKLLRAAIPATIEIKSAIPGDSGQVLADPTQIHQVVMNLCTNAYHAMRDKGGLLQVQLENLRADAPIVVLGEALPPGDYVKLSIRDTGCGMDEATRKQIFLPFFTTKKAGEGTGLGLSIVHGIVTGTGGGIDLESEVGQGSVFHLYFPRIESIEPNASPSLSSIPKGKEQILVVDDEAPIGDMVADSLNLMGYHAQAFHSSPEALEVLRADPGRWDAVITDLTMPGLTGLELAKTAWALRPNLPILLMTGYSEDLETGSAQEHGFSALLHKPAPLASLARTLRSVLDAAQ